MFVIFGLGPARRETRVDFHTTHCDHCNNTKNWIKAKETLWFSLFFIPVIPVKTSYLHYCPICNQAREISRNEWERA